MSRIVVGLALLLATSLSHAVCDYEDLPLRTGKTTATQTTKKGNLTTFTAPIRSLTQLQTHLGLYPASSPLAVLSPSARREFLDRLTFNEKGLTGYNYAILEKELTPSQIYSILALFGSQNNIQIFKKASIKTKRDALLVSDGGASTDVVDVCNEAGAPGIGGGAGWDPGGFGGGGWMPPIEAGLPTGQDYLNMACFSRATCKPESGAICKASC